MVEKILQIILKLTGAEQVNSDLTGVEKSSNSAALNVASLGSKLSALAKAGASLYIIKQAFDATVGAGLRLYQQFEDMQVGIAAVIAAASSDLDKFGNKLSAKRKFELSTEQAKQDMATLREENKQTTASLGELTEAYQSVLATSLSLGLTNQQTIKLTRDMANAAASIGVPMNQLSQEIRAIFQGDTSRNSRVNQILGINEATIKAKASAGELFEYLQGALKEYSVAGATAAQTYTGLTSNIGDTIDSMRSGIMKPLYDELKHSASGFSQWLSSIEDTVIKYGSQIMNVFAQIWRVASDTIGDIVDIAGEVVGMFLWMGETAHDFILSLMGLDTAAKNTGGWLQLLSAAIATIGVGIKTITTPIKIAIEGFKQLGLAAEYGYLRVQKALGLADESELARMDELAQKIDESKQRVEQYWNDYVATAKRPTEILTKSDHEPLNQESVLVAKPRTDEDALKKAENAAKKAQDAINSYILETDKRMLESKLEQELLSENQTYLKLLESHTLTAEQKAKIDEAYSKRVKKLKSAAALEDEKRNEESLLEYYKATNQNDRALEIEHKRYLSTLDKLNLTQAQKDEMMRASELELERQKNVERLKHEEKYYEAIGELGKANYLRMQREALELQNSGYTEEQTREMMYGSEARTQNYDGLMSATGTDTYVQDLQNRLNALSDFQAQEVARIAAHYGMTEEMARKNAKAMAEIKEAEFASQVATASVGFGAMAQLMGNFQTISGKESKSMLRAQQAFQVAQAIMNTYTAASNAYASAGNPYLGAAMAALAIVQGMAQVAQIKSQTFHTGGVVGGSGEVPATLLSGEGVLNRGAMSRVGESGLNALNSGSALGNVEVVILNQINTALISEYLQSKAGRTIIRNTINKER